MVSSNSRACHFRQLSENLVTEEPRSALVMPKKDEAGWCVGIAEHIVVAAEGALEAGGSRTFREDSQTGESTRFGGIGEKLARQIEAQTGHETRSLVLGHLQRGGEPIAYDRLLALRFGSAAVELVRDGCFGCMVALRPPEVLAVPLKEAVAKLKLVPPDGDLVRTARNIGVSFGDE